MSVSSPAQAWQGAESLVASGDFAAARAAFEALLDDPELAPMAQLRLSLVASAQGRYRDAVDAALAAFAHRRPQPHLLELLAKRLFSLGEREAALACATDPVLLQAGPGPLLAGLGKSVLDRGFPAQALPLLRRARELGVRNPRIGLQVGLALLQLGDTGAARRELQACLVQQPGMPRALAALGEAGLGGETLVAQLRASLQAHGDQDPDAPLLHYSLFAELDALGKAEPAWDALDAGMRLRWKQVHYDPDEVQELFEHLRTVRAAAPARDAGDPGTPRPVFIVGMPRSGADELRALLARHPGVTDAGELRDLVWQLRYLCNQDGGSQLDMTLARGAESIDFAELGRRYLAHTRWRAQARPVYLDAMPGNFALVSYIVRSLPQARILHMVRAPMATCFLNLATWYPRLHPHSYDQGEMADQYRRYRTLMAHWRALYPDRVLDVRHDELVAEPEVVVREVLAVCGLPVDPAATPPGLPAVGASEPQWRRYEQHLGRLREHLGALAY